MDITKKIINFALVNKKGMIVTFDKEYLRELYETGKGDKKHRFRPDIVKRYQKRIDTLKHALNVEELLAIHSLNYEVLKGDKAGISSIRVNDQYRIEFTIFFPTPSRTTASSSRKERPSVRKSYPFFSHKDLQ